MNIGNRAASAGIFAPPPGKPLERCRICHPLFTSVRTVDVTVRRVLEIDQLVAAPRRQDLAPGGGVHGAFPTHFSPSAVRSVRLFVFSFDFS